MLEISLADHQLFKLLKWSLPAIKTAVAELTKRPKKPDMDDEASDDE